MPGGRLIREGEGMFPVTYLKRALCLFPALGACLLFLQSLFLVEPNDWDLDAFLYLGSRLWKGELLYVADFETKLPAVQYLFAIAFALGGVGAWKIMTFAAISGLGIGASFILVRDARRRGGKLPAGERDFVILIFGLFAVLLYALPGARSAHLEMMSAAGAFMSLALLAAHSRHDRAMLMLLLSGIALSFAALIRPNHLFIIPAALLFILYESGARAPGSMRAARLSAFLAGFLSLIALCFAPYLFIPNGPSILIEGLSALSGYADGTGLGQLLQAQWGSAKAAWFYAILYGLSFLAAELMLLRIAHRKGGLWICAAFCILAVAALNVSLLRTHYWSHNAMMFVPYVIPLALYVWDVTAKVFPSRGVEVAICGSAGLCAIAAVLLAEAPLTLFLRTDTRYDFEVNQRGIDPQLLEDLRQSQQQGLTFLAVSDPIYHALLGESRIGDGHPVMLIEALRGRQIGPIPHIPLFARQGSEAACLALVSARKDIIVLGKRSIGSKRVYDCLASKPEAYRVSKVTRNFAFFERTGIGP